MQTAEALTFNATDYLDWEATQEQKHEFFAGEIFAVAETACTAIE